MKITGHKTETYCRRYSIVSDAELQEAARELAIRKASSSDIRSQAIRDGMMTLRQAGVAKAVQGLTSIEEILRVTEHDLPA